METVEGSVRHRYRASGPGIVVDCVTAIDQIGMVESADSSVDVGIPVGGHYGHQLVVPLGQAVNSKREKRCS